MKRIRFLFLLSTAAFGPSPAPRRQMLLVRGAAAPALLFLRLSFAASPLSLDTFALYSGPRYSSAAACSICFRSDPRPTSAAVSIAAACTSSSIGGRSTLELYSSSTVFHLPWWP